MTKQASTNFAHDGGIEYRSIDGSGNNLSNSDYNVAGTDFTRIGPAQFADGVSEPVDGPNPRMVSNVLVGQGNANVANNEGLSGMMYAWGQFIDHDLDLSRSDGVNHIDIAIPPHDTTFTSGSTIPMTRAVIDPATGHDGQPATAVNSITGWLDASMVYGSDRATSDSLRLSDGHMKTSTGDNLPIENGMFVAGDERAQENPSLTSLQTLFLREHNYQVDRLHNEHPNWTGEHLYQQARAIVTAEIQNITYSEFLPHLLGPDALPTYDGYDANVDPRITEEFAGAAFRFGHSIVSGETERIDEYGALTGESLELKDTFFMTPADFTAYGGTAYGGADGFLRHLLSDPSQAMDARIVDDLRNFLVDPPAGQDLAAINIQRGRDLGLGTLNETREALGLAPYTSFKQITDDAGTLRALKKAYGSVDKIDLWSGGLSEGLMPGAMIGETFGTIIARQFENLRAGDRLWFENQGFDAKVLNQIEHTTLSDIIARNTDTKYLQDDAFVFYNRHSGTAGGVASEDPDAPQLVIGSNGTDTLVGGPQGDMLVAGKGDQTMTGGGGNDQFVFDKGATRATITDYKPGRDALVFENASTLDYRDVHINSRNGDAVVNVGNDQIVLVGVNANQLNAHDFIFNSGDTVSHAHAATGVTVNLSTPSAQNTVGAGTTISAGTTLELASASSAAVTFTGSTGTLKLDNSASFTGTVAGLTAQDKIDFADISFATVQQPTFSGNASGGTLTVTDGTHTANVALLGNYLASTFVPSSDGHSGTSVVDQPSAQALVAQPHHA